MNTVLSQDDLIAHLTEAAVFLPPARVKLLERVADSHIELQRRHMALAERLAACSEVLSRRAERKETT